MYIYFPGGSEVKNLPADVGDSRDAGLIPGLGRSPGGGNGNPLQNSCLENPRDRGAWWAAVYGVAQSRTRLKQLSSSRSNIDTDVENRFEDKGSGEEVMGEMNGDCSTEAYTLPYAKQTANGNLLYDSGTSNQGSVTT